MSKKLTKAQRAYVRKRQLKGLGLIVAVLMASTTIHFSNIGMTLRTSVFGYPEHAPYDGVVNPLKEAIDWVNIPSDLAKSHYQEVSNTYKVALPYYNPTQLEIPAENLKWGDANDNKIRNAKITYSVPYMGSYEFNGKEGDGAHPAVDIKVLKGTPVYAMGNGTVVKSVQSNAGFGNHVVLQHNNFPSYSSSSKLETIYSSYSHMEHVYVQDGEVVTKGQQIGTVGSTGTSTTPHLHFQIDNDNAPHHPYWPFTWSEASAAGLDFWEAVNAGLNQSSAYSTTINPMKYIQKYKGTTAVDPNAVVVETDEADVVEVTPIIAEDNSADFDNEADSLVGSNSEEEVVVEVEEVVDEMPVVESSAPSELNFEFTVRDKYYIGKGSEFQIEMRDQYGNAFSEGFKGEIVVSSANGNFVATKSIVGTYQFNKEGNVLNAMKMMKEGRDRVKVTYDGETYYSKWFNIVKAEGNDPGFSDVRPGDKYYEAIAALVDAGVVNGYNDGTFKPNNAVTRVEALKFIYEGIKKRVYGGNLPFRDVDRKAWYGTYLYTAYDEGVVSGYNDGTFRPTQVVNKAEFYKLLFNGMGVDVATTVGVAPYSDVGVYEWHAPYISYAKDLGVVDPGLSRFQPAAGMTRGEVAYAIYKLMEVMK